MPAGVELFNTNDPYRRDSSGILQDNAGFSTSQKRWFSVHLKICTDLDRAVARLSCRGGTGFACSYDQGFESWITVQGFQFRVG